MLTKEILKGLLSQVLKDNVSLLQEKSNYGRRKNTIKTLTL